MDFGVIGYGYWGPNIVRNLAGLEGVRGARHIGRESRGAGARPQGVSRCHRNSKRDGSDHVASNRCSGNRFACLDPLRVDQSRAWRMESTSLSRSRLPARSLKERNWSTSRNRRT